MVREARETVVYRNSAGDVVIRQRKDWPDEQDDPFMVIPLASVRTLIRPLEALLTEAQP